jgi:hypothetical protein
MTDTRRLAPPSREQWLRRLEEKRHPASRERSLLWRAAAEGEISTDELYRRLAELKQRHGEDVYDRKRLPATPMPTRAT